MSAEILFEPFALKTLSLRNRIVMAPMTRSFSPGGVPAPEVAAYYRRRAEGEVGLILSEGVGIDRPAARNEPGVPVFHGAEPLAGWKRVIDQVHDAGGHMGPQLWHVGAMPSSRSDWVPPGAIESPSGLVAAAARRGGVMSEEDIADTVSAFAGAAADARRLGFDTVEIHGAHGYLLDQFFWHATNLRAGPFGGETLAERTRFAVEVIKAIRGAVGPDYPIILRLSQWKQQDYGVKLAETPDAMARWLAPLAEAGVDVFHCSQRRFWESEFPELDGEDGLNFAGWAKKLTGAVTISVGSVGLSTDAAAAFAGETADPASLDRLVARMDRGEFDLIAVGRALLQDAQWASKIRRGDTASLQPFRPTAFATLS